MNVQATRLNTNDYNVRVSENKANNNLDFSYYLNQATAMKSGDTTFSEKVYDDNHTSSNYRSSVLIGGICWDDKKYAEHVMQFKNLGIKIDNPINWGTTGEHQLTKDEIDTLKNKYDVTNLSEQGYYDLMVDLSHLNAVKPEDIISEYYFIGDGVICGTAIEIDYNIFEDGKLINNLLGELHGRVNYYKAHNEMVNSAEFAKIDKFLFAQKQNPNLLLELKMSVQERLEDANRYYNIIAQLARDH